MRTPTVGSEASVVPRAGHHEDLPRVRVEAPGELLHRQEQQQAPGPEVRGSGHGRGYRTPETAQTAAQGKLA